MNFSEAFREVSLYFERTGSDTVLFSGIPDDQFDRPDIEILKEISNRIGCDVSEVSAKDLFSGNTNFPIIVKTLHMGFLPLFGIEQRGQFLTKTVPDQATEAVIELSPKEFDASYGVFEYKKNYINKSEQVGGLNDGKVERQHWLMAAIRPYWRSLFRVAIAALFINFLALASPLFVMNVYDRVIPNEAIPTLWVLVVGMAIALSFDFILKFARSSLIDYTGRKIDLTIAYVLFQKVMSTSLSSQAMSTGEYANRVSQYEFVREFFTSNTISTLIDTAFIFIFIAAIYFIGGNIAIVPAVALLLVIILGLVAQYLISKRVAAAANEAALRQSMLVETIHTIETVKSLRAESTLLKRWRNLTINSSDTNDSIKKISSFTLTATQFIQQSVSVVIVLFGVYLFSDGTVTMGAIIASVMLSGRAVGPLSQLAMTLARFRQAVLSLRILNGIMQQEEDTPDTVGFVNREIERGDIKFDKVHFRYPNTEHDALEGLSFSIKSGETVGIIGRIGSGKTTIGRLMCRLYQPTEGRVLVEGIDMQQFHPSEVRKAVAYAGQTSDLFTGSLKENLLMGNPAATDQELIDVAQRVGINKFVERHPSGFDMQVGENGSSLSSGQKQSVAIARLLLTSPKVIFLDEPSGAMDLASERQLIKCLKSSIAPETTLIISTHRFSMLELVDRLIVIEDGKTIADGPKDQVIQALQRKSSGGE